MQIGDILTLRPTVWGSGSDIVNSDPQPCRVVYIHPQRRFYTVEFDMPRGRKCRESYYFPDRAGDPDANITPRRPREARMAGETKRKKKGAKK